MSRHLDRFFRPPFLLILGLVLGLLSAAFGLWNWIEPSAGLATMALAGATWWQTRKAREAVYADLGEGSWIIALQVGRPISEAVKKQFGRLDALIDIADVLKGEHTLSLPEHYELLARAVYRALCAGQSKNIHMTLSGPVALNFLIGQLTGLFHFQLTIYQFDAASGSYMPLPRPTRAWLDHRS